MFAKKKPKTGMTGGKPKKKKAPSLKKLKEELWELCKQITRLRYQNPDGLWICYTCDRPIDEKSKAHTGHGIASAVGGLLLRYHLDNLRVQDYYCNINLGGNGFEFRKRLTKELGHERVEALDTLKGQTLTVGATGYISQLIVEYKDILRYEQSMK